MICKITKRSFNPLCYRFLLSILLKIWGGAGEMLYLHSTKREVQLIQNCVFLQGQQLMDLEHKLTVAKEELEKTALDKVNNTGDGVSPMSDDDRMNKLCEVILVCLKTFFKEWISNDESKCRSLIACLS